MYKYEERETSCCNTSSHPFIHLLLMFFFVLRICVKHHCFETIFFMFSLHCSTIIHPNTHLQSTTCTVFSLVITCKSTMCIMCLYTHMCLPVCVQHSVDRSVLRIWLGWLAKRCFFKTTSDNASLYALLERQEHVHVWSIQISSGYLSYSVSKTIEKLSKSAKTLYAY